MTTKTITTTCHNWTREENKKLMVCFYKSKPTQKEFMHHIEMLWREKHLTATLDMEQLNNQQYSIMKKHLLSDLELEEWHSSREIGWRGWLTGWDSQCLPRIYQLTFRPSGKRLWTIYRLSRVKGLVFPSSTTDRVLAQTNLALDTIYLRRISLKLMHWSMSQLGHYRKVLGKKGSRLQTPHNAWQQQPGEED